MSHQLSKTEILTTYPPRGQQPEFAPINPHGAMSGSQSIENRRVDAGDRIEFGQHTKIVCVIESKRGFCVRGMDDPSVGLAHAIKDKGSDMHLLLRGEAVAYAAREAYAPEPGPSDSRTGGHPGHHGSDVADLIWKGVKIFVIREDLIDLGLAEEGIIGGLTFVSRAELPDFLA